MRGRWRSNSMVLALMLSGLAFAPAASAQAPTGPLAEVGEPSATVPVAKPAKPAAAHRGKAATAKRTAVPTWRVPVEAPAMPAAEAKATKAVAPTDPLSFGMKWNGSTDTAGQTRIENLHGSPTGTGAELGMKLHF